MSYFDNIKIDDSQLQELFKAMDPKNRVKLLKTGYRRTGTKLKNAVKKEFRSVWQGRRVGLERGVRMILMTKKAAGFRITIGPKGNAKKEKDGVHVNRWGKSVPLLMWAETGAHSRHTRGGKRKMHGTGSTTRYGFYSNVRSHELPRATENLKEEIRKSVIETSIKYGCKQ